MKKLFLIPLMAMLCTVMAWGTEIEVSDFASLKAALSSGTADVVKMTQDIAYPTNGSDLLNITRSVTLDGQGHKISGYGSRGGQPNVIAINYNNSSYVTVELKNLDIYSTQYRPVETRGYITKLTLDNVNITSTGGTYNPQGLTIGGVQTSAPYAQLVIKDSKISATASGYPVIFWNPTNVTLSNSDFNGYCGLYFKTDAKHSVVNADACNFDAPNVHSGHSNDFAVFALEDGDMTFNLNNCGMNGERLGNQGQSLFSLSEWTLDENRGVGAINITLSGDNSYFNVSNDVLQNGYIWKNPSGSPQYGPKSEGYYKEMAAEDAVNVTVNFTITGGTYSVNPANLIFKNNFYMTKEGDDWVEHYDAVPFTIPATHEVKEITTQQGDQVTTLYRVREVITTPTSTSINDNVEGEGEGQNENTQFLISSDETVDVPSDAVIANYVEVSNNATLTVPEDKVLVVTNGLDVTDGATVEVAAGSTVIIGEGGVTSENSESIVIEANEDGAASFLLNPDVIVNTTPALTVKMETNVGKYTLGGFDNWVWHRFAMPMRAGATWTNEDVNGDPVATYFQGWNYGADDWATISPASMQPFYGYILTHDLAYTGIPGGSGSGNGTKVTYIFKGNLVGNEDLDLSFAAMGWNFFGNSYTAYIETKTLLAGVLDDPNVGGTVYVWNANTQTYEGFSMEEFRNNTLTEEDAWAKEIAPMHTFILQKRAAGTPEVSVNYRSAIWGNPRYAAMRGETPAPARLAESTNTARVFVNVIAANGQSDRVKLMEDAAYTDAYDDGADATKYMNQNHINLYVSMDENFGTVATNNLAGKILNLQTSNDINYTMTFDHLFGTTYAIKDMQTNIVTPMTAGNTYTFAAQPNTTIEGRFVIVPMQNMPTDVETVENTTAVKGIYTIMGQYVGEDFDILPAGVYVVDGVKIVK